MNKQFFKVIAQAQAHWGSGRILDAGQLLFDVIPRSKQPAWAAKILSVAAELLGTKEPAIDEVLQISRDTNRWREGRQVFEQLRWCTLREEGRWFRTNRRKRRLHLLYLAENVAKVTYNASLPPDAFDEDAGWWVVRCFHDCIKILDGKESLETSWAAIVDAQISAAD